jgi:hypothetical protein
MSATWPMSAPAAHRSRDKGPGGLLGNLSVHPSHNLAEAAEAPSPRMDLRGFLPRQKNHADRGGGGREARLSRHHSDCRAPTVMTPESAFTTVDLPCATWPIVPMLMVAWGESESGSGFQGGCRGEREGGRDANPERQGSYRGSPWGLSSVLAGGIRKR